MAIAKKKIKVKPVTSMPARAGDVELSPAETAALTIFSGEHSTADATDEAQVSADAAHVKQLEEATKNLTQHPGTWRLRRFRAGEVICAQGEAGFSAYYLLKARDVQQLPSRIHDADRLVGFVPWAAEGDPAAARPLAAVYVLTGEAGQRRRDRGFLGLFGGKTLRAEPPSDLRKQVEHDVSAAGKQLRTIDEGELFGEISCRYGTPRSATIVSIEDCYVLEVLRSILDMLLKNKELKADLERKQQERALASHLENLPILLGVSEATRRSDAWAQAWAQLSAAVTLVEKQHGDVIYQEGEAYDGTLYVISVGQVRVTQLGAGGERILSYRTRGDIIGEMAVLKQRALDEAPPAPASAPAPAESEVAAEPAQGEESTKDTAPDSSANRRSATCTAYFHPSRGQSRRGDEPRRVELVRIEEKDFRAFTDAIPEVLAVIARLADERSLQDRARIEQFVGVSAALSGQFADLGLMQGRRLMLIDLDRCTRCDECVRGCVHTHDDGRTRLLREGPRFGRYLIPATCRQCRDPVCLSGCPVASIHTGSGGQILIEDWCIGCTKCAEQCPYGAINMNALDVPEGVSDAPDSESDDYILEAYPVKQLATVCDQCESLADGQPSCVYACPHDAALRVDALGFFQEQLVTSTIVGESS